MRFLDIAVAVVVGVSAIAGLGVWRPGSGDAISSRMALQAQQRDQLVSFVGYRGLPWLLRAPPAEVCSDLTSAIGGPARVYAVIGTQSCGAPPPQGAVDSNLTLRLLPFQVELVAWSSA